MPITEEYTATHTPHQSTPPSLPRVCRLLTMSNCALIRRVHFDMGSLPDVCAGVRDLGYRVEDCCCVAAANDNSLERLQLLRSVLHQSELFLQQHDVAV
mmetsp:Transcript_37705/g.83982  ORF Transcript_37705/g.83982 Transcript_37705/m.83982 type:complete len:99 (+) Transcript_37705:1277-1573(+)